MANAAQNEGQEEQGSWMRTILNAVLIYFAINAVTAFVGGRLGPQKNVTSDGAQGQPGTTNPAVSALWPFGTKMV
jgi:hypothetical protein